MLEIITILIVLITWCLQSDHVRGHYNPVYPIVGAALSDPRSEKFAVPAV